MKHLFCFIAFFTLFSGFSQSFYQTAKSVEGIGYRFTDSRYRQKSQAAFKPIPANNWYNVRASGYQDVVTVNGDTISCPKINVATLKSIEVFYIKTENEISPNMYGRAEIQQWTFSNADSAANAAAIIAKGYKILSVRLEKAPWAYWQKDNRLYFVLTAGQYMDDDGEYQKIVGLLKEKTGTE